MFGAIFSKNIPKGTGPRRAPSKLGGVPLVITEPLDPKALSADRAEAGVDGLGNREGPSAGATLVVMTNLHVREAVKGSLAGLTHEPVKTSHPRVAHGELASLSENELTGLTDDQADVGVRAILERSVLAILGTSEDMDEKDLRLSALFSGLARSLDPVGEATFGVAVQESDECLSSEKESEDGVGEDAVGARVVHG